MKPPFCFGIVEEDGRECGQGDKVSMLTHACPTQAPEED